MDKLAAYKLNNAYTDGVEIGLDNSDVVFMVRLPSMYNREYTQALYSGLNMDVGEDGTVTGTSNIMDHKYAQEDAFFNYCLVSMDGDPIPSDLKSNYPAVLEELIAKATEIAGAIEEEVETSVKKSLNTSSGKDAGGAKKSSTVSLSSAAI